MQKRMNLRLFEPGMTQLHRVGLAGLYMTLKQLKTVDYEKYGGWKLSKTSIELFWKNNPRELISPILNKAFNITNDGIIEFLVHKKLGIGNIEQIQIHNALLLTYLQHGQVRGTSNNRNVVREFDGKIILSTYKPVSWYVHNTQEKYEKILFNKSGDFMGENELINWNYPGGVVRHNEYSKSTKLTNTHGNFLKLIFAPIGSLFFLISTKNHEGKFDKRRKAAIVLPHLKDLESYDYCFRNYLHSPVDMLYANSMGDAGLNALVTLSLKNADGMLRELDIDSCTIFTMGITPWAKQQKNRTAIKQIRNINIKKLSFFCSIYQLLHNKIVINEDNSYYVRASMVRGLLAENIAADRPWFYDFKKVMSSRTLAKETFYDRKGLHTMINEQTTHWPYEEDKLFVEAIHTALRNRFGELANRNNNRVSLSHEFTKMREKIRTSLMRAKNAQTMRAEIADLFARGGINRELQQNWERLLSLFTGSDWQKTRDLALLALASYMGKETDTKNNSDHLEKQRV